ncbi:MAG: hypothetical protein B5M51_03390 [Anaerolinea sp. 4484_236]|nr:MAG: hypothetical protein B5M51_03390 [Anaerolinea sp. 4484_236]
MENANQKRVNNTNTVSELDAWRARTLNFLLLVTSGAGGLAIIPAVIIGIQSSGHWAITLTIVLLYLLIVIMTIFRRISFQVKTLSILLAGYLVAMITMAQNGLAGVGPLYLLGLPILSIVLLDIRTGIITSSFSVLVFLIFGVMAHFGWSESWLVTLENPRQLVDWIGNGTVFAMLLATLTSLLGFFSQFQKRSLQTSQEKANELDKAYALLEKRIKEEERRANQFKAIAQVARKTTELLTPEEMLQQAVTSIKNQFNFNAVAVFWASEEKPTILGPEIKLEAIAGSSPGTKSYSELVNIAQEVIQEKLDTSVSSISLNGVPFKQLGIPLRSRGKVLGTFVIQTQETSFYEENIEILQILADQITTAHDNARLFAASEASLRRVNALYQQYAPEAWQEYLQSIPDSITYVEGEIAQSSDTWQKAQERAQKSEEMVSITQETASGEKVHSLAVPVNLRGLPLGIIGFHRPIGEGPWQQDEMSTVQAITDRLVLTIENIRLLEDTQRRAAKERLTSEITARMRETLDMDTVLQTAIREIGGTLDISRIKLRMSSDTHEPTPER